MTEMKTVFSENCSDVGNLAKKIRKGYCPNFFLYGASLRMLEEQSLNLSKQLELRHLICYQGIVKNFTILMPYYETGQKARDFMNHLNDSLSIARDCYDQFRGNVVVELDPAWAEQGRNTALSYFADYMRENPGICFILFLAGKPDQKENIEMIVRELASAGVWMRIHLETPDVDTCVLQFCEMAEKKGFHVPERTQKELHSQLERRCETDLDNMEASHILLKQIVFEHSMRKDSSNIIEPKDVLCMSGVDTRKNETVYPIGFMGGRDKKD